VIRIRYEDFSAGTHEVAGLQGRVERCARGVTVCLLPGLNAGQRRAVLRRLRQEGSRGFGPALPLPQLKIALGLDRVRAGARVVRAIVRLHPAVTLLPGACVLAMVTLFVAAAGDRPGIAPSARGGPADAAAVSGIVAGALESATSTPVRVIRVATATGRGGTEVGGAGLGSGRAAATPPHGGRPAPPGRPMGNRGLKSRRGGAHPPAWYTCPSPAAATRRPHGGQLACRRPAPGVVPFTAHRPGPVDFAW